jgi:hypothetical protein
MFTGRAAPCAALTALAVATTLSSAPLVTAAGAAESQHAVATRSPAAAAAGWLARQLVGADRDHYNVSFNGQSFPDDGLTADGVLSMDAAHVAQAAAKRMTVRLQKDAASYAGTAPNYYPGSLAKLLLVAEAQHVDIHDFGGIDLVSALQGEENSDGLYDDPDEQYGYESPLTQALALIALSHTGSAADKPNTKAVKWLVGQQCDDGGISPSTTQNPAAKCTDADASAFGAQALLTVGSPAADAAVRWLHKHRNDDGGFGLDDNGKPASNANSTAVAAQALLQSGGTARGALRWLTDHQVRCAAKRSRRGAVRYATGFDHATALRATTQATQALARRWLGHIDNADAADAQPRLTCTP